jgi:hypothetical protein
VVKKTQQSFFNIRRLTKTLTNLYRYNRLVWQLHHLQPQVSPEGGAVCTTHYPEGEVSTGASKQGPRDWKTATISMPSDW